MTSWYMVTVVGSDRPGIVAALSAALYRAGANLGEASMARLGGNFTIMVMVETDMALAALERAMAPVATEFTSRVHADPIDARLHAHAQPNVQVTVYGADRAGIVAEVTGALAAVGFSVLDLASDVGGSAQQPLYIMILEGHVTGGVEALESALAPLRQSGIDVRISPIDALVA